LSRSAHSKPRVRRLPIALLTAALAVLPAAAALAASDPSPAGAPATTAGAPDTTIDDGPSGSIATVTASFEFSSPDAASRFQCSFDSAPFAACASPQALYNLGRGAHTFRVRAIDASGTADPTPASRTFAVDTSPPETSTQPPPATGTSGIGGATDETATTSQTTSSSNHSLKRSAPEPVPAWYMTARGIRDLRRQARNDACAFARRQSNNTRVLLLDFGKAVKHHGEFGARLRAGRHFSNHDILSALRSAAERYRSNSKCYSRGSVRITYGNTNNMPSWMSRPKVRKAGRRQAMMANRLRKYQRRQGRRFRHEGVAVAGDIEPQWNKPRVSKSLVRGATLHKRGGLYFNYGAASQCPPETSTCANNWSFKNLGQVSYGGVKRSLPEIYRAVHVKQWTNVRRRWNNQHHRHHFCFYGTTATPGFPLTASQGWTRLAASNRCVQEELVNIREQ